MLSFVQQWRQANGADHFTIISQYPELDREIAKPWGIEVVGHQAMGIHSPNLRNVLWLFSLVLAVIARRLVGLGAPAWLIQGNNVVTAFVEADLIADLSGDSYRDRPGGFAPAHNFLINAATMMGTPICLVSQSLGPFRPAGHAMCRKSLDKVSLIWLRESSTPAILDDIGAKRAPRVSAPDVAFALALPDAHKNDELWSSITGAAKDREDDWIGISTNCLMLQFNGHDGPYVDQMVQLIRHIRSSGNYHILLVPHTVHDEHIGADDVLPCRLIASALGSPDWLRIVESNLSPIEMKGVIAKCAVLIAARMHAGIAGLSSSTPTAMISWSHKYRSLMDDIGLARYTWEFGTDTNQELLDMFDDLWRSRGHIRGLLDAYNASAPGRITEALGRMNRLLKEAPCGATT